MKQDKSTSTCGPYEVHQVNSVEWNSFPTELPPRPPARSFIPGSAIGLLVACSAFWLSGCAGFTVNRAVQVGSTSASITSLTCSKTSVTGGGTVSCTVTLSEAAPATGLVLSLSSSSSAVQVPQSITIPGNASSATFSATVSAVKSSESVTLTGVLNGASSTFSLELVPASAKLTVNSSSVSFGSVQLNVSATQSITLTSSGSEALTISSVAVNGSVFSVSGLSFPATLNPGQTATLNVKFDPTSASSFTGQVTISSNSSTNSTMQIALNGAGVSGASSVSYQIALTWTAPASSSDPVAGYKVYRAPSGSATYQLLNSTVDSQTAFNDSNVSAGSTYQYYVTSVDNSGVESTPSNVATIAIP